MASIKSRLFYALAKLSGINKLISRQKLITERTLNRINYSNPPDRFYSRFKVESVLVQNKAVFTICPACSKKNQMHENTHKTCILYIHGGGYVMGLSKKHWHFISHIISNTNCTVIVPDYPLVPHFTAVDAYKVLYEVYVAIVVERKYEHIIFMGDSAGGGLALGLAELLKKQSFQLPKKIILLSPWLDIEMKNQAINEYTAYDPILSLPALRALGKLYAGHLPYDDYRVSPINGISAGLPPIALFIGTRDILYPDCVLLHRLCKSYNIPLEYYEYIGMGHIWMIYNFAESAQACLQIMHELDV